MRKIRIGNRKKNLDQVLAWANTKKDYIQFDHDMKQWRASKIKNFKSIWEETRDDPLTDRIYTTLIRFLSRYTYDMPQMKKAPYTLYLSGAILLLLGRCGAGLFMDPLPEIPDIISMMILLFFWLLRDRFDPLESSSYHILMLIFLVLSFFEIGNPLNMLLLAWFAFPQILPVTKFLYPASIIVSLLPFHRWIPVPENTDGAWICMLVMVTGYALIFFYMIYDTLEGDYILNTLSFALIHFICSVGFAVSALLHMLFAWITKKDALSYWILQIHPFRLPGGGPILFLLLNPNLLLLLFVLLIGLVYMGFLFLYENISYWFKQKKHG